MKVIKKISFGLFLLVSLAYLFVVISPRIFEGFYPFGIKTAMVISGSMEPTLNIDDFVIMKRPKDIKVNDIVSYKSKNSKYETLHRIVSINEDVVITKGDANNTEDDPIKKEQITGIYIGKIKYLGKLITIISKPIVFAIIITLFVIFMFIPSKNEN